VRQGAETIVIGQVVVATSPSESVTWMLNVPVAVGVPVTAPVEVFSVRPAGNVPTMENVYGATPPVTVMGPLLNGTPTVPVVVPEQVIEMDGTIVITQPVAVAPRASVTLMVKVPDAVGVPVTAPVEVFRVRPAGNVPTIENVYGATPPVTVIGPLLNGTPTSPVLVPEHVIEIEGVIVMTHPVAVPPSESVTLMEKLPDAVGVPVTAPVEVFRVKPAGNVPTMENV
jgi:propanediol utilization protein